MWRASKCSPSIDGKRPSGNNGNSLKFCSYFIYVERYIMFHLDWRRAMIAEGGGQSTWAKKRDSFWLVKPVHEAGHSDFLPILTARPFQSSCDGVCQGSRSFLVSSDTGSHDP